MSYNTSHVIDINNTIFCPLSVFAHVGHVEKNAFKSFKNMKKFTEFLLV